MIDVEFKIEGLERLAEGLKKAPVETLNQISIAVQKSAMTIQSNALKEAPVNKQPGGGNLRQNIRTSQISKTKAEIVSKAPYSGFVEYGTAPHLIKVKNKQVLANRRMGQVFGKIVHHPGTRPNPYMKRALEKSQAKIAEFFRTAMANIINTLK
jgi:HK97 gp10 family phage protein